MTKIVPNDLINPTEKTIKNWNCSFIAVEGPNILDKLSLEDLAIPYESQYRSRIILKAGDTDQPLIYGFIGAAVTFLMIKVTYDSTNDPYYQYEQEKYNITYYFENDPILRPLNRLMVMTGSADNKIPQIYLNNPLDYDVVLDVLHATTDSEFGSGIIEGFGISNLSDVILSNLTSGDTLVYDGGSWINSGVSGSSGSSGTNGTSGSSGSSGIGTNGTSGSSGINGTSGTSGTVTGNLINFSITTQRISYSATTSDQIILCSGTTTIWLPVASGNTGKMYWFKNIGGGNVTITPRSNDRIDTLTTKVMSAFSSAGASGSDYTIVCDGTSWWTLTMH